MATIRQRYEIRAPLERVWQALVDPDIIARWSGANALMDDQVRTEFSLWEGDITGNNVKVEVLKELVQEWRYRGWKTASVVTFQLRAVDGQTTVELIHENVPEQSKKSIDRGWRDYYLGAIKTLLEA